MKRYVFVGLGLFGSAAAEALYKSRQEVIAVDTNEARVNMLADRVSRAVIGDGRQSEVLRKIGAEGADAAIVSTGNDIGASILAALALNDLGVREIFVKVISHDHARIVRHFPGVEAIFPEHESALNLSGRILQSQSILKYVKLGSGLSLQEMAVPISWEGKTLRELAIRATFQISVVAIHDVITDTMNPVPDPDRPLMDTDTLILSGSSDNLNRIAELK